MMIISLQLDENEAALVRHCAEMKHMSVSEFVRQSVLDRIEDELDLQTFDKAMAEYQANPVTYTLDEVEEMLGL